MRETMKGNQNALKHGGAAAAKAIARGEEFTGVPALREEQIARELAEDGREELVKRRVIRYQVAADCYHDAAIKLLSEGQFDRAYDYFRLYATLQNASLRGWLQVAADEKERERGGVSTATVLESIRRAKDGKANP